MTESISYQIGGINNQITDEFGSDNDLEVTGGGKGWVARTTISGEVWTAKSRSKLAAAELLYESIKAAVASAELIDEAIAGVDADLDDEGMTEGEFARCVAECVTSVRLYCDCRCEGRNHGAATGATAIQLVNKYCLCGCGEVTQRQYVPGHDARHHGAIKLAAWVAETGFVGTDEEARKARSAGQRKAARDRKAALLAEQAARVEAVIVAPTRRVTSQTPKTSKQRKIEAAADAEMAALKAASPHGDDLPF